MSFPSNKTTKEIRDAFDANCVVMVRKSGGETIIGHDKFAVAREYNTLEVGNK